MGRRRTVPSTSCDISLACMSYLYFVLVSPSDFFLELTLCIKKTLSKIVSFSISAILYGLTGFSSHVPDGSTFRCFCFFFVWSLYVDKNCVL